MALVLPSYGVVPNSTTWVGWWIQREEGWHTYWKHPGNVGLTPHLEWKLPDGFRIENLQFPFPHRVQMAGVKAYGHHGETLYLSQLHVPENIDRDQVNLTAKARWMVCENVCLPQYAELSISFPVLESVKPDKKWDARFSNFRKNRPLQVPEQWNIQATEVGKFTKLSITKCDEFNGQNVYLFGKDYLVCSDAEQKIRNIPSGFELLLPKPTWPEENPTHLNGLLRVGGSDNLFKYYPLKVPLN